MAGTATSPLLPGFEPVTDGSDDSARELAGTVVKVLHADLQQGRTIARITTASGRQVVVTGRGDPIGIGDEIKAEGRWTHHPTFGRQFEARHIQGAIPETPEGICRYLDAAGLPGVGKRTGEKLVARYGNDLPRHMESPASLTAAGIPDPKARAIVEHWKLRTRHARLLSLLYAHGMGPATAQRIVAKYGDGTMRVVQTDPYKLADEVRGIGFKTADRIALSQGIGRDAPERVRAGLRHQMQLVHQDGSCAVPRDILRRDAAQLLEVPERIVETGISALLDEETLVEDTIGQRPVLYETYMRDCEIEVAERLFELSGRICDLADIQADPDGFVDGCAAAVGFQLHENQRAAVRTALEHGVSVVTGGPGAGKTATLRTLIQAIRTLYGRDDVILLAAPTGRAAKRMHESTDTPASTVHRLLEWSNNPQSRGFQRNSDNPLACEAIAFDEFSMMDLFLVRDALRATAPGTRVIMVGDEDQLESVGPGSVLSDVIASGALPVTRLTKIFRQAEGSGIARAAQEINGGALPTMSDPRRSSDIWKAWVEDPDEAAGKVVRLCAEVLPTLGWHPLRDVQVLTPGHASPTGTKNLNVLLQEALNPGDLAKPELHQAGRIFRLGDRVVQIANDHDREVYNGDVGYIVDVSDGTDGREKGIVVDFDGDLKDCNGSDIDRLQHAFATSIHKSQGSEFPVVVCVVTTQHYVMLRRNLIYTAVTRARSLCCVIGQERALRIAVKRDGRRRLTGLSNRLAGLRMAATALNGLQLDSGEGAAAGNEGGF